MKIKDYDTDSLATRRIYTFGDGTVITETAQKGKRLDTSTISFESYNGSPLIDIDYHNDFQSYISYFQAQEDTNPIISVESDPGVMPFAGAKPGASVKLYITKLFDRSANKLEFNNDGYRKEYINDVRSLIKDKISNGFIHHVDEQLGNGIRKCYVKINDIGGDGASRLFYKAYIADRKKNIIHVYLLYAFYKKGKSVLTNGEAKEIINTVKNIDNNYKGN
jgi:hypothetical protein